MSTKTTFKRIALVAVASLGFGVLTTVAPANAADVTGTVTPVSVSFTGANLDASPYAMVSWTTTAALTTSDTITVSLTAAPSAAAFVKIVANTSIGATRGTSISDGAGTDSLSDTTPQSIAATAFDAAATAALGIQVDTAGYYAGTITTTQGGTGAANDTVSFSFTTRGKATSFTTSVSAATVSPSGTSTLTVTMLDAAGNVTQPTMVDSFGIAATSGSYASSATALSIATAAAPTATNLYDGTAAIVYTAGSTADTAATLTVTPQGTLGSLAAQTATVTTDATVIYATADSDIAFTVTAPADAATATGTVDGGNRAQSVRTGSSAITVKVSAATASKTLRFKITASAGTVDGTAYTTSVYKNIQTDADGIGYVSFTLGGGALLNSATTTVEQVTVVNASIAPGTGSTTDIVITQANAAVTAATLSMGIAGSIVRALGTVTSVDVTVKDQFTGALGSGWTIRSYRGSVSAANLLSTGTTNASGVATVSVSPLSTVVSGGSETYVYTADYPGVTQITTASESTKNLTVTYTTTGGITSLSTAISGTTGATTPVTDTTLASAVTIYPAIIVPTDGSASDAAGDQIYTVSTAAVTGTAGATAEVITLASDAVANNTATYTADAGAFVSTTATTAWNAGLSTVTVAEGASVYAFATTTGLHTITVTSGGKTVLIKFWAYNLATDYYTVSAVVADSTVKPSSNTVVTVTVKDIFGNVVDATDGVLTATASDKVRLAGQALSQAINTTVAGTSAFTIIGDATAGTGTITIAPTTTGANAWAAAYVAPTGAAAPVSSATVTITVEGAPAKSAELLAIEAIQAKAAADKAESDAKIALLQAALDAAATKAAADKAALEAKIAASQAAAVAAAEAAADAAAEAIDAGNNAYDAAGQAGEAADAATAAAEQAGEDAVAAAEAAGAAAVAAAEAAQEAAAEATDAANAATDAANASAEAADAATAAAQDAADAVAALSTQVSEMISALKKQITALTNLVIKIQKKVKA